MCGFEFYMDTSVIYRIYLLYPVSLMSSLLSEAPKSRSLGGRKAPLTTNDIILDGEFSCLAVTDQADYVPQQFESGPGGKSTKNTRYPKNLGACRTEPIIWIGYAAVNDTERPQPLNTKLGGGMMHTHQSFLDAIIMKLTTALCYPTLMGLNYMLSSGVGSFAKLSGLPSS